MATDESFSTQPEPAGEPEPESEPINPSSNATDDVGSKEGVSVKAFAEPVPDWGVALPEYGKAWEFHIYFVGAAFALLGLYSFVSIVRLRKRRLLSRGYFLALNAMLLVLGVDRAVYMFVDAYNYQQIFPLGVAYLMLGLGFPCLTSAFSILFLALLQSTKTQLVPPKIQKPSFLAVLIAIHFLISLVSDTLLGYFAQTFFLTLICQVTFIVWGLFLCLSFMVIFRRLYRSTVRLHRESVRLSISKRSLSLTAQSLAAPRVALPKNSWGSAIKLTSLTAFLGVMMALLQLYGIIVVYSPVAGVIPEPWPWWAYQFIFRCVELAMCFTMSYVATQPFRYTKDGQEKDFGGCRGCCRKKEEEVDDYAYWAKYFEAAPPTTFLPKRAVDARNANDHPSLGPDQTSWNEGTTINDASVYESNSLKKLVHKDKRFKNLTKTCSTQDLHHHDLSKLRVTSASFSSFGIFLAPDPGQVILNDLQASHSPKNHNMNASHELYDSSPALASERPVSPVSVNRPLLSSESSV